MPASFLSLDQTQIEFGRGKSSKHLSYRPDGGW